MKALHLLESPGVSPGPAAGCMDQPSLDFPGKTPLLTPEKSGIVYGVAVKVIAPLS